jgi:two-component system, chemotaxis family, sensor kinase CheA
VTQGDAELVALLVGEVGRHVERLSDPEVSPADVRAILHALKGSLSMARQHDLAMVISQLKSRYQSGEPGVVPRLVQVLSGALERLGRGEAAFATAWPEPPPELGPARVSAAYRADYLAAMRDRMVEVDLALSESNLSSALARAYRSVHGMKATAASVGDEVTAWYCHGLESRLRTWLDGRDGSGTELAELARHRAVLVQLLEHPDEALGTLRALGLGRRGAPRADRSSSAGTWPPAPSLPAAADPNTFLSVPASLADRFLERLERIDLVHDEISGVSNSGRVLAAQLRELRARLLEALRLIGPPRPWGAPAAALRHVECGAQMLGATSADLDGAALTCRRNAEVLHSDAREMRVELAELRRTTARTLFDRVAQAVRNLSSGGPEIQVETVGAELPIDRRLGERLFEPVLQLARNAVAHGIEPPEVRTASGKTRVGTITLRAAQLGEWLRIVVEDDGRGVDASRIRELALGRGTVPADMVDLAQEDELLGLLFLPGFTTRDDPDLLAGRGVGLDLAQAAVRRLGGAIRLARRPGSGLAATVEVPSERGLVEVVWLRAGDEEFALPVGFTGRVFGSDELERVVPLTACLGLEAKSRPPWGLELVIHGVQPVRLGVDTIGEMEEASIRPVPALVAAAGPYSGAILRSDGSLRLTLDAALLAARAWSHLG